MTQRIPVISALVSVVLTVIACICLIHTTTTLANATDVVRNLDQHNAFFATDPTFGAVANYFKALARDEGGVYAFEILKNAELPPAMDTHLIGHFVGDIMYTQEGLEGMQYCDGSLGYACAHSVVINALVQDGPAVFEEINTICDSIDVAGSYEMCFHGFGHGVLAYADYEVPDAVELCGRVGTEAYGNYEAVECLGGVIMEMRGGIHNERVWEQKKDIYLDSDNPLAMCQADYMPDDYRGMCYIYITPFIFDAVSDRDIPKPSEFSDAMQWCDQVATRANKNYCYGGFGKEFIGFVHGRDVRNLNSTTPEDAQVIHDWCRYAVDDEGEASCVEHAMYGAYRAGSVGVEGAVAVCSTATKAHTADACFAGLFATANTFHPDPAYADELCTVVPAAREKQCRTTLAKPSTRPEFDVSSL